MRVNVAELRIFPGRSGVPTEIAYPANLDDLQFLEFRRTVCSSYPRHLGVPRPDAAIPVSRQLFPHDPDQVGCGNRRDLPGSCAGRRGIRPAEFGDQCCEFHLLVLETP
jgi:hypothetical protein